MTAPGRDDHPFESPDERDHDDDDREQWLRENVPPHHG
jgi:hypothetical protein